MSTKAFRFNVYDKEQNYMDVTSTDKRCIVSLFEITMLIKPFPDYDTLVL